VAARRHRLSAGVVVVRRAAEGWRFLLLRAFNHWDFPKGMVEEGEEPRAAALREVEEESGIADLEFEWGDGSTETGPYSRGKVARYFIASTRTAAVQLLDNPEIGRPEHAEFRWASLDDASKLVSPRLQPVLKWAAMILNLPAGKS
jgi:bis(5'-nucleosidyl)-tetraphosphatase